MGEMGRIGSGMKGERERGRSRTLRLDNAIVVCNVRIRETAFVVLGAGKLMSHSEEYVASNGALRLRRNLQQQRPLDSQGHQEPWIDGSTLEWE